MHPLSSSSFLVAPPLFRPCFDLCLHPLRFACLLGLSFSCWLLCGNPSGFFLLLLAHRRNHNAILFILLLAPSQRLKHPFPVLSAAFGAIVHPLFRFAAHDTIALPLPWLLLRFLSTGTAPCLALCSRHIESQQSDLSNARSSSTQTDFGGPSPNSHHHVKPNNILTAHHNHPLTKHGLAAQPSPKCANQKFGASIAASRVAQNVQAVVTVASEPMSPNPPSNQSQPSATLITTLP